jgi:methylglyoxal synthase
MGRFEIASLRKRRMKATKRIALVAHDERKQDLLMWVRQNTDTLAKHELFATGTTGKLLADQCGLAITCMKSGPLGGDQMLGAMIAKGELDLLIFFWDPMSAQPHDVDVKALMRMSVLYNIPTACNRATADFLITSPWFNTEYEPVVKDYSTYTQRPMK